MQIYFILYEKVIRPIIVPSSDKSDATRLVASDPFVSVRTDFVRGRTISGNRLGCDGRLFKRLGHATGDVSGHAPLDATGRFGHEPGRISAQVCKH